MPCPTIAKNPSSRHARSIALATSPPGSPARTAVTSIVAITRLAYYVVTIAAMDAIEAGIDLQLRGEWDKAAEALPPAIEAAREAGEGARAVLGTIVLGVTQHRLGLADRAAATLAEAIERSAEWPVLRARAHYEKAVIDQDADAIDNAVNLYFSESDTSAEAGAWSLYGQVYVAALRGDLETADASYARAIDGLAQILGANDGRLVDLYVDLAALQDRRADAGAAHAARVRAFEIARTFAGADAPVTRAAADPIADSLRRKEAALRERETALGVLDTSLIEERDAIKTGWTEIGNSDEAEAYLHRCRALTTPDTWLYRNLTFYIGYLLSGQQRREAYADLWKEFLAAREAICAPAGDDIVEAFTIVTDNLRYYVPADELLALSERALAVRETCGGLRALAKAYRAADRRDDASATWKRTVDHWIEDLRAGSREHEPAISDWVNDFDAFSRWSTDEPLSEAAIASIAVYDDAYARAVAVVGADEPVLGRLMVERASRLSNLRTRVDEAGAELERARTLVERVEGPKGETVNYALFELAEHHHRHSSRDIAIVWLRELIRVRTDAGVFEAHYDRARLAQWLEQRDGDGDVAEALAIREQLVLDWPTGAPHMITNELAEIARIHIEHGDLAAATATCDRFAGLAHLATENVRSFTLDAWWMLARAKCAAEDLDGARAAIDALVELWQYAELIGFIETKQRDAYASDLPIANHLNARIGERVFVGADASRALAASIAPDLTDDSALVLADALTAAGDPRGELIVLAQRIAATPDDTTLTDRRIGLVVVNRTRWMGPLAEELITWHLGYWKAIRLPGRPRVVFDDLAAVLDHPSAQFLDTIVFEDTPAELDRAICDAAAKLARVPHVRITHPDDDDRVAALTAAIPALELVPA